MTADCAVRTVIAMGTAMYGSYDCLVIEDSKRKVRIPLEDVAHLSPWAEPANDEVLARFGHRWHPTVVVELVDGGCYVVHLRNARWVAEDLSLRGVGVGRRQRATAGATS